MNKILSLAAILCLVTSSLFAQNKPAPEYLLQQNFPDSVLQMTFLAQNGETVSFQEILDDKKGQKVFVDIWASWCKDCLAGLPGITELQEQTEDVSYVFLSVDRGEDNWRKALDKYQMKGDHYYLTTGWHSPLTDYINLDWIPRYFVLNEQGKIILSKSVETKDSQLKQVLLP